MQRKKSEAASPPAEAAPSGYAPLSRPWLIFFIAALVIGAGLRLSFGNDIEFKYDEWFMFNQTQQVGEPLPQLGMESGVGVRNPPLSIWMFLGLGRGFSAHTPPELARAVQILNVLALGGLFALAWRWKEAHLRESWLWALALICVNPLAVLLQRKIWAQSTLPIFCVLFLWAWSRRERRWGALVWGLAGMWLGQIHMTGFIFVVAVLVWTAVADALRRDDRRVAWIPWLIGTGLGLLTMLTWLKYYLQLDRDHSLLKFFLQWFKWPELHSLFWQLWVSGPLGLGLSYSLGDKEFIEYLKYPLLGGQATYLMGAVHVVILGLAGTAVVRWLMRCWRKPVSLEHTVLGEAGADTYLLLAAAIIGYGTLLTLNTGMIPRHYLMITFPLEWLWLVLVFRKAFTGAALRRVLLGLWICQLILSLGYLGYIHVNQGAQTGDYGVGFQWQQSQTPPGP